MPDKHNSSRPLTGNSRDFSEPWEDDTWSLGKNSENPTVPWKPEDLPDFTPTTAQGKTNRDDDFEDSTIFWNPEANQEVQGDKDPVVGWLVGIEGENRGRSFEIKMGRNSIGRGSSSRIKISGETISREGHAIIIYEKRTNSFLLLPPSSERVRSFPYLNDIPVHMPSPLNAYDQIEFEPQKFLFIPLCSDRFVWPSPDEQSGNKRS